MKKHSKRKIYESVCCSLGITQRTLAALLGVSRSQLSMYELGKRRLNVQASNILSLMRHEVKQCAANRVSSARPTAAMQSTIEKLQLVNLNKLQAVDLEIEALSERQAAAEKQTIFSEYFTRPEVQEKFAHVLHMVHIKPPKQRKKSIDLELFKLEIRQRVLEFERELLEEEMRMVEGRK